MIAHQHEPCTVMLHSTFAEDTLMRRVRGEYREMPGMRLSVDQAMRMWVLDRDTCNRVLHSLVTAGFLEVDRTGRYTKAHGGY
jgi:hypothetical protein